MLGLEKSIRLLLALLIGVCLYYALIWLGAYLLLGVFRVSVPADKGSIFLFVIITRMVPLLITMLVVLWIAGLWAHRVALLVGVLLYYALTWLGTYLLLGVFRVRVPADKGSTYLFVKIMKWVPLLTTIPVVLWIARRWVHRGKK